MLFYLTKQVQFATKLEAFEKRGLAGSVSCKANESGVLALMMPSPNAQLLYGNIHFELPARLSRAYARYQSSPKISNCLSLITDGPKFEYPTLIVEMKAGGEALHAFGMFEAGTSKMGLYAGKPDLDGIRSICALDLDFYNTVPAGNVNQSGYLSFLVAWRGIHAFFKLGGGLPLSRHVIISEEGGKRVAGRAAVEAQQGADGSLIKDGTPAKSAGGSIAWAELTLMTGNAESSDGIRIIDVSSPPEDIGGFVFPFFREMLEADADSTFTIFNNLFRFCFADDADELAEKTILYRRGFRYLASTLPGKIIQHIYFGINLAISMGAKLHLLKDGAEYAGFVLESVGTLLVKNSIRQAGSADAVADEIRSLNTHSAAVEKIHTLLYELGRIDGKDEEITVEMISRNPRFLRAMIQARTAEAVEPIRSAINDHLPDLKYNQTYWEVNPKTILAFMAAVSNGVEFKDEPMYVHTDVLFNRSSKVIGHLSVFGGQAPSIYAGDTIKAIAKIGVDDPNLVVSNGRRAVPHIPYTIKGLIAASADWASVARTKTFRFRAPKSKKQGQIVGFSDSKHRDGFISNPDFDTFYTYLRGFVYREDKREVVVGKGKKRDAMDIDDEEGGSPKGKKVFRFV